MMSTLRLLSDQVNEREIAIIKHELQQVLTSNVDGDVVEFGCYVGTTSVFLQSLLVSTDKKLHVYDSFSGLPAKSIEDHSPAGEQFKEGELTASKQEFINNFKHLGLPLPIIHKCWFSNLLPEALPNSISFAYLDGDYYHSILDPLKLIWPKLTHGARIVIDDYHTEQLPGVKKAVAVWGQHHGFHIKTEASLAIIEPF